MDAPTPRAQPLAPPVKQAILPGKGEQILATLTKNTYTIGERIGEGQYGVVFGCTDVWNNDLAVKVLKPIKSYEEVRKAAEEEFAKLLQMRHPHVSFVHDAFEYRDTFYIVTERCYCPISALFTMTPFDGRQWIAPVARCLLQAVNYLHLNGFVHQDIHPGNVFAAVARNELGPWPPPPHLATQVVNFKLGDLGISRIIAEVSAENTLAEWMRPPEARNPKEFGAPSTNMDLYHTALLLLQLAESKALRFTDGEILAGRPREMALALPQPLNFALEKALRRHVASRTQTAMELWMDLTSDAGGPLDPDTGSHHAAG